MVHNISTVAPAAKVGDGQSLASPKSQPGFEDVLKLIQARDAVKNDHQEVKSTEAEKMPVASNLAAAINEELQQPQVVVNNVQLTDGKVIEKIVNGELQTQVVNYNIKMEKPQIHEAVDSLGLLDVLTHEPQEVLQSDVSIKNNELSVAREPAADKAAPKATEDQAIGNLAPAKDHELYVESSSKPQANVIDMRSKTDAELKGIGYETLEEGLSHPQAESWVVETLPNDYIKPTSSTIVEVKPSYAAQASVVNIMDAKVEPAKESVDEYSFRQQLSVVDQEFYGLSRGEELQLGEAVTKAMQGGNNEKPIILPKVEPRLAVEAFSTTATVESERLLVNELQVAKGLDELINSDFQASKNHDKVSQEEPAFAIIEQQVRFDMPAVTTSESQQFQGAVPANSNDAQAAAQTKLDRTTSIQVAVENIEDIKTADDITTNLLQSDLQRGSDFGGEPLDVEFAELVNDNVLITHTKQVADDVKAKVGDLPTFDASNKLDPSQFDKIEFALQGFKDKNAQIDKIAVQLEPLNMGVIELTFVKEENNSIKLDIACENFNTLSQLRSSEDRINAILAENGFNTENSNLSFSFSDRGQSGANGREEINKIPNESLIANDAYEVVASANGYVDVENNRVNIKV